MKEDMPQQLSIDGNVISSSEKDACDEFIESKENTWTQNDEICSQKSTQTECLPNSQTSSFLSVHMDPQQESVEVISTESERQILLLMLLAQICALHDPTPRTFTVHVLELYEREILDRDSISFLFDLGLVPDQLHNSPETRLSATNNAEGTERSIQVRNLFGVDIMRSKEASAIRERLQHQELLRQTKHNSISLRNSFNFTGNELSWSVDHHPLCLSRYYREFRQIKLLNSGAFGSVFHVSSKMDGCDYAIKRVTFLESGYSSSALSQVVREVQCLAHCDHPNVIRYHTSWLEPSWVTGSGTSATAFDHEAKSELHRNLLTSPENLLQKGVDSSYDSTFGNFVSDWTSSNGNSDYQIQPWDENNHQQVKNGRPGYNYQTCFFIQMQLCQPRTLADFIRERNQTPPSGEQETFESAIEIFVQILKGIDHIHDVGIIHRDMKPANCLIGHDGNFKIGDFGLSKLLHDANYPYNASRNTQTNTSTIPSLSTSSKTLAQTLKEALTKGIGTAAYCAPEQVSSNEYDSKADIFSIGLILLELVCSFGTEHERIQTFHDCRRGILPSTIQASYPEISEIIRWCTNPEPCMRPSAKQLMTMPFLRARIGDNSFYLDRLSQTLNEKEEIIQQLQSQLLEKDKIIEEMRAEILQLKSSMDNVSQIN